MTGRSHIGYLVSQYPAPSHTFIRREVEALRARGLTVSTYSVRRGDPGGSDPLAHAAAATTFTILAVGAGGFAAVHLAALATSPGRYAATMALALRHRVPGVRATVWALFHFAEAIVLARRLRADGVTALHNHFANAGATVGMLAAHFLRLPWSLTLHGISEFDYPAGLLLADKITRARFAACVSRFGIAQAMRLLPPDRWHRLHLVRCGIDLAGLPANRPAPGIGDHLVCVGRLSPEKGQAGLIAALAEARKRRPDLRLTLVGDGPEGDRLHMQVIAAGMTDAVHFAGRLDEAATLATIAAADMLVLPSFMEGLPVVLMEAMALGVPVIATRVAGIPELVRDGESGLLFDPADWAGLAEAVTTLAGNPDLRARLAAAGRVAIDRAFTIDCAVAPLPLLLEGSRDGRSDP